MYYILYTCLLIYMHTMHVHTMNLTPLHVCNQHHVLKLTIASVWSQNILLGTGNFKCQFLIGGVNGHGNSLPAREGNGSLSTCDIQSAWAVYIQCIFQLFQAYNSHLTIAIQSRYLLL